MHHVHVIYLQLDMGWRLQIKKVYPRRANAALKSLGGILNNLSIDFIE